MRVVIYEGPAGTRQGLPLSVVALEGQNEGKEVGQVERILIEHPALTERGITGDVAAVWGLELIGDPDNDTIKGLCIGKPWPEDYKVWDAEHTELGGVHRLCIAARGA